MGERDVLVRYRGRAITRADVTFLRALIAGSPAASRRQLSQQVCTAWGWVQPNGAPRDMVCRGLMLALARAGHLVLPPVRRRPLNPLARRARPRLVPVDPTPLRTSLRALGPLVFAQVRRTAAEPLFNSLLDQYHYLGYTQPVGEHLKFLVSAGARPLACFVWSSAPRHLGPRDRYLGWSARGAPAECALRRLQQPLPDPALGRGPAPGLAPARADGAAAVGRVGAGLRPPGVLRGDLRRSASAFAAPATARPTGACSAARRAGATADRTHRANRPVKEVLGYPLVPDFRAPLDEGPR